MIKDDFNHKEPVGMKFDLSFTLNQVMTATCRYVGNQNRLKPIDVVVMYRLFLSVHRVEIS